MSNQDLFDSYFCLQHNGYNGTHVYQTIAARVHKIFGVVTEPQNHVELENLQEANRIIFRTIDVVFSFIRHARLPRLESYQNVYGFKATYRILAWEGPAQNAHYRKAGFKPHADWLLIRVRALLTECMDGVVEFILRGGTVLAMENALVALARVRLDAALCLGYVFWR